MSSKQRGARLGKIGIDKARNGIKCNQKRNVSVEGPHTCQEF